MRRRGISPTPNVHDPEMPEPEDRFGLIVKYELAMTKSRAPLLKASYVVRVIGVERRRREFEFFLSF